MYKDSDVFALENHVDHILDFSEWKDAYQIAMELEAVDPISYENLIKNRCNGPISPKSSLTPGEPSTRFLDAVIERLCFLFPMKYEKNIYKASSNYRVYKDSKGNSMPLLPSSNLYRRKLNH